LTKIFKENRIERVMKKLLDYGVIKEEKPEIKELIKIAGNYSDEFDEMEKTEIEIGDDIKKSLKILVSALNEKEKPEDIQNTIYQIAKSNDIQPKDFFKILYQIILGTTRGPKIGPFITDIGLKQVAKTLSEYT